MPTKLTSLMASSLPMPPAFGPTLALGRGYLKEGKGSAKIGRISRNLAEHFHSSVGTDPKKWDPGITALVTDS